MSLASLESAVRTAKANESAAYYAYVAIRDYKGERAATDAHEAWVRRQDQLQEAEVALFNWKMAAFDDRQTRSVA